MRCAVTFEGLIIDAKKHNAKTFDLVWIWLGGDFGNVFLNGFSWDSVINMCKNYLHGSLSEQRTHEFIHIYLATASVSVWIGTVSEASLRRNLKLRDETGIVSISDMELFKNLTLMGYNISQNQKLTFQKGQFSHQWKYLIHTIMQYLSPKSTGFNEFSSNIATALVSMATNRAYKFSKMIFDAPRATSPAAEEGSMQQTLNELTAFCTSLQRQHSKLLAKFQAQEVEINRLKERVKNLEDQEGVIGDKSGDDAPIKGRSSNEGGQLLKDGFIPTAGPPVTIVTTSNEVGPTASPIVQKRKGKEIMVEFDTPKKKKLQEQIDAQMARELEEQQEREDLRMNEQIARDAEVARIYTEEEI
nr:synaptobrevin, longin-like domain protein [Tanacetum cinerariifolium]